MAGSIALCKVLYNGPMSSLFIILSFLFSLSMALPRGEGASYGQDLNHPCKKKHNKKQIEEKHFIPHHLYI